MSRENKRGPSGSTPQDRFVARGQPDPAKRHQTRPSGTNEFAARAATWRAQPMPCEITTRHARPYAPHRVFGAARAVGPLGAVGAGDAQ
jgi:hypothetical protein